MQINSDENTVKDQTTQIYLDFIDIIRKTNDSLYFELSLSEAQLEQRKNKRELFLNELKNYHTRAITNEYNENIKKFSALIKTGMDELKNLSRILFIDKSETTLEKQIFDAYEKSKYISEANLKKVYYISLEILESFKSSIKFLIDKLKQKNLSLEQIKNIISNIKEINENYSNYYVYYMLIDEIIIYEPQIRMIIGEFQKALGFNFFDGDIKKRIEN